MKQVIILSFFFISLGMASQNPYQKGMQKAFELWGQGKNTEASQLFERISKAEKNNWLPNYYVATLEIISTFGIKNEAILTSKLNKAQEYLDKANALSPKNPEIIITQALLHTAYIAFDGQKYGMVLSGKNSQLYAEALAIAPENPRVVLGYAEWNMGAARFFGKSTKPYCEQVKKAIELGTKEDIKLQFYPRFQVKRAKQILKQCEG